MPGLQEGQAHPTLEKSWLVPLTITTEKALHDKETTDRDERWLTPQQGERTEMALCELGLEK